MNEHVEKRAAAEDAEGSPPRKWTEETELEEESEKFDFETFKYISDESIEKVATILDFSLD